jgi:hypothetical protein
MNDFEGFYEFTVGSVMSRTWSAMWSKPVAFIGITIISSIIATLGALAVAALVVLVYAGNMENFWVIVQMIYLGGDRGLLVMMRVLVYVIPCAVVAYMIIVFMFQGAVTYAVFELFMRGRASVWEGFKRSIPRALSVFIGAFIAMLTFTVVCVVIPIILGYSLRWLGAVVGIIIAAVGSVVLFNMWYIFAPACVVERLGPVASLSRSSDLTKGYRGKISGILMLFVIVAILINAIAEFIGDKVFGGGTVATILVFVVRQLPMTYAGLIAPVIYYSLRVVKEGLAPENLADIFD